MNEVSIRYTEKTVLSILMWCPYLCISLDIWLSISAFQFAKNNFDSIQFDSHQKIN